MYKLNKKHKVYCTHNADPASAMLEMALFVREQNTKGYFVVSVNLTYGENGYDGHVVVDKSNPSKIHELPTANDRGSVVELLDHLNLIGK